MRNTKRFLMVLLALIVLVSSTGPMAASAQTTCRAWHTVRYGQTLSSIAAYYGVYWPYLAQVNNIGAPRYTIYTGTVLCIPAFGTGGTGGIPVYNYGGRRIWSFTVASVNPNTSVTVQTYNIPDYVTFRVRVGQYSGGGYNWVDLPNWETGTGGSVSKTFNLPAAFNNQSPLVIRLIQNKKNGRTFLQDQVFYNQTYGTGGPGPIYYPPYGYYGVPTIWIASVAGNASVTITTHNFPPGLVFDVLMGPIGTRAIGGYHVGTLNSGTGGTMTATFPIPAQLQGLNQIAIRTQNAATGYFSYNWFYNN